MSSVYNCNYRPSKCVDFALQQFDGYLCVCVCVMAVFFWVLTFLFDISIHPF